MFSLLKQALLAELRYHLHRRPSREELRWKSTVQLLDAEVATLKAELTKVRLELEEARQIEEMVDDQDSTR